MAPLQERLLRESEQEFEKKSTDFFESTISPFPVPAVMEEKIARPISAK